MSLAGKTLFITGASRGIGLCMAKRFAADGANIVIASKTVEPHRFLPGTIHETVEEVEKAGGKALAIQLDVRDADAVAEGIKQAADHFGGIDVLVHNAGAYWLKPTTEFSAKRHDLVFDINERAYFLLAQAAHPYLVKSDNPHILGLAPPLDPNPIWLMNSSAYTVSKFAMSLYTIGWAEEWKADGIAVNTLWPRCGVYSPSAVLHGGEDMAKEFRKPEIMADAAYGIVTKPSRQFSGNACIDDTFLYENGETDFDQYAVEPGHPLVQDYMVPASSVAPPGLKFTRNRLYDFFTGELLPGAQVGMGGKE
ncbi:MAG: SDR family oxidoreductase [Pseudomonadales bacterium]|nr:SDR family oxidoreductase [Pseudomonadales bacterium]